MKPQVAAQAYLSDKAVGFLPFVPNVANSQYATYFSKHRSVNSDFHLMTVPCSYNSFGSNYAPDLLLFLFL